MVDTKRELEHALPFAMEPVVYDFAINERGTFAEMLTDAEALMPSNYYTLTVPVLLKLDRHSLSPLRRAELDKFGAACRTKPELRGVVQTLFDVMLPKGRAEASSGATLSELLSQHGFDPVQHEQIRADLKEGRVGLVQNRLPASAVIENVKDSDISNIFDPKLNLAGLKSLGERSLKQGEVAVVTLAAGAGSRWTQGAGVVKALHPFCKLAGRHRTFAETHLARSRKVSREARVSIPHIFTTSYLTHSPIEEFLARQKNYGYEGPLLLSPGNP